MSAANILLVSQLGLQYARLALDFAQLNAKAAQGEGVTDADLDKLAQSDDGKAVALDQAIARAKAQRLKKETGAG